MKNLVLRGLKHLLHAFHSPTATNETANDCVNKLIIFFKAILPQSSWKHHHSKQALPFGAEHEAFHRTFYSASHVNVFAFASCLEQIFFLFFLFLENFFISDRDFLFTNRFSILLNFVSVISEKFSKVFFFFFGCEAFAKWNYN